jgi:membrane protease YdiL (CAAX protease family)
VDEGQPPARPWRWWIHLGLMVIYVLPNIVFANHARLRPALTNNTRGLLFVCAWQIVLFAILFVIAWLASRASAEDLLLRWRPRWWVIPLGLAYSIGIRVVVGVVIMAVFLVLLGIGAIKPDSFQQTISDSRPAVEKLVDINALRTNPAYFWIVLTFGSFVVAGLREEMWRASTLAGMRALWPNVFNRTEGQIVGVSLIAVLFGAAHLQMGIVAAGATALLGLALGVIMVVHKSIWPAVLAHGFFDATSFALLPYAMGHLR